MFKIDFLYCFFFDIQKRPRNRYNLFIIISSCFTLTINMKDYQFYLQSQREKQTKQIINKIDIKHYFQQRKLHSEGTEISFEYSQQLKYTVKRSKTEKISLLEKQNIRQRMMTEVKADLRQRRKTKIQDDTLRSVTKVLSNDKSQYFLNSQRQKKSLKGGVDLLGQNQGKIEQSLFVSQMKQVQSLQIFGKQSRKSQINDSTQRKHGFLPMLELYIQQQETIKQMNSQQRKIRNLIVTMIILAINRRLNSKPLDALQTLLQSQIYFPKQNKQMIHLKSIWLQLIGKIYLQTKKQLKQQKKGKNRWRNYSSKSSSTKLGARAKRQNTIFVKSLASRKIFLTKFSESLRKSKLIFETTYMSELINEDNQILHQQNTNVNIFKKIDKSQIYLPDPRALFRSFQLTKDPLNYTLIIINKDEETNLFPLNFPSLLTGFMVKKDYINKIVKINTQILPSTRCFSYNTSLFHHYQIIISILISILIISAFLFHLESPISFYLTFISAFVSLIYFGLRLQFNTAKTHNSKQANKMIKICLQWQKQYQQFFMIIDLSNNYSILSISFPIQQDIQQQISEDQNQKHKQINGQTRRCSIKVQNLTVFDLDGIQQENNNDIIENETQNKSFCYENNKMESQVEEIYNFQQLSQDQFANQTSKIDSKAVEIELIPASPNVQFDFQ